MKNFKSIFVMVTISMGLMSCSSEEIFTPEDTTNKLLENFTVKRDASGAYSLGYSLASNGAVSLSKDKRSNSNDFYLYSSDIQGKRNYQENMTVENNSLKIGFTDSEAGNRSSITILDDDIKFSRGADEDFLVDYSVTNNGDGTVSLNFNVADDVTVDYIYDGDNDVYEIHLRDAASTDTNYTKTFVKEDGVPLQIEFLNYTDNSTSSRDDEAHVSMVKKPVIIMD